MKKKKSKKKLTDLVDIWNSMADGHNFKKWHKNKFKLTKEMKELNKSCPNAPGERTYYKMMGISILKWSNKVFVVGLIVSIILSLILTLIDIMLKNIHFLSNNIWITILYDFISVSVVTYMTIYLTSVYIIKIGRHNQKMFDTAVICSAGVVFCVYIMFYTLAQDGVSIPFLTKLIIDFTSILFACLFSLKCYSD